MKWELQATSGSKNLIKTLLTNREINSKKEINEFLHPDLSKVTAKNAGIDLANLKKAVLRIKKAIKLKEKIIIYGDYDVDGVCASAILWETLSKAGADVMPFIPSRFEEGYGLSVEGILSIKSEYPNLKLIITVDNGIVAETAVDFANREGIDVIITDHHTPSKKLPKAYSIVHTTMLCGAGVAYLLSKEFNTKKNDHLSLVALATVADLVPLIGANRTLLYFGLQELRKTKRPGLLALLKSAGIETGGVGVYEIGHMIAPRLNAMGRLENALDSLRLVCTTDKLRAQRLAQVLSDTNLERQQITITALEHAKGEVVKKRALKNLIFIASDNYQQGIVGLVAGRLVEEYYLPSVVISKGRRYSKASARSIKGFNITEFLRTASDLMVDIGGHPMAAGFTVETEKLEALEKKLLISIEKLLDKKYLERSLRVDLELPERLISLKTYQDLQQLAPFGMGNPEPTFLTRNLIVGNLRIIGNDRKHLKLELRSMNSELRFSAIYFRGAEKYKLQTGDRVNVVYTLDENKWNGNSSLQLKIKDLKIT